MITLNDILEAIVGELAESEMMAPEPAAVQRDDGSWLLDGLMPIEEVLSVLKIDPSLVEPRTDIQNLADFGLCAVSDGNHSPHGRSFRLERISFRGGGSGRPAYRPHSGKIDSALTIFRFAACPAALKQF